MANIAFVYGCLSTILYMVVHLVVAVLGRPELIFSHENSNLWFGLGTLHILVLGFTFGPYGSGPAYEFGWPTLIDPTENAVRTGRIVVGLAAGNLVYWFVQVFRIRGDHEAASVLSAIALLFAVILAATWGLRLENLVSPFYVARAHGNPTSFLSSAVMRAASAKRRAIPFGRWMTGLLECCDLAARSTSAVRDATDCKDPRVVDCVEFTYEVLDELESRACVIHHRDKLSAEGQRAIRRFVHSVAAIRAVSPDPVKWQNIVDDAKTVLAMRDRLLEGDANQDRA